MLNPVEGMDDVATHEVTSNITAPSPVDLRLRQTEVRYRGLLEAAPDAMIVVNPHGKIVLLNVRAEKQFGYSRNELLGERISLVIPKGFSERLAADSRRSAPEALAQQIGMGIELCGLRKNGSEFPIEIMLSPLKSPEGIIVTAAIRDITARKEVEQRLLQTEARYRGLLEAAPDAMVVVNERGEIVLLNIRAEEQFGYKRDQLVGRDVTTIIPQGFAERLVADGLRSASEALEQQIGTGIELVGMRRDGSEFPIEIMLSPLQTAEGVLVTAAIRDITVRKANEKALRDNLQEVIRSNAAEARLGELVIELNRSNEDLAQFANIASHDLQEPLRMVTSFTQLLSRRYKGRLDAEADEYIAFAVDGATRMKHLIQDLLAYSRAGAITAFIKISSRDILRQSLARLARAIEQSGAEVTHDALPFVQGDEAQLVQLFERKRCSATLRTSLRFRPSAWEPSATASVHRCGFGASHSPGVSAGR
jgi:PAS domain S-box-containing protein